MSQLLPVLGRRPVVATAYARALRRTCVVTVSVIVAMLLPGDMSGLGSTATAHQAPDEARWTSSQVIEEPYITPKAAATAWVEKVGSWDNGNTGEAPAELRETLRTARTVVQSAQLADSPGIGTSVIVIARQTLNETPTKNRVREVALQVYMAPTVTGWTAIPPPEAMSKEKPRSRPISPTARRVLESSRVALSTPARQDVEAGVVDDRLLELVSELACRQRLDIAFFVAGYRGSDEGPTSQHVSGRAADIRSIDGQAITPELAEDALGLMRAANRAGAVTAGPIRLDESTSAMNSDHIHIGLP